MDLITDLEQNKVLNLNSPDKIIETMLSKIFFFGNRVYKIYKWEKAFYGDLSDVNFRKQFIAEDFFWNNIMSPDIYKELLGLRYNNGQWEETSFENADDLVIVMNKLKSQKTFTDFAEKEADFNVLEKFVNTVITNQRKIADFRKEELSGLLNQDLKDIERQAIEDLRDWGYMAQKRIPKEKTDTVAQKLLSIIELPEYKEWCRKAQKSACMDGNGDNIIIDSGEILFIDILPPKFNWRVEDEVINIGRAAADLSALSGSRNHADFLYESYKKLTGIEVPQIIRDLYEIRGAMIQAAYRSILNQKEREKKYLDFLTVKMGSGAFLF